MVSVPSSFALAYERQYAIVLENLSKVVTIKIVKRINDKQPRHRIF